MTINRKKAVNELSKIKIKGNSEGLIPNFGVFLNQLPCKFWNSFSTKILEAAGQDLFDDVAILLENAAAECGYHTEWGIINSYEFNSTISPMIEKSPEDVLYSAFAVFSVWGWANAEIVELIPGEKMVIHAYSYYEADIQYALNQKKPSAYMMQGVSRALMDIAYGDKPYPNGLGKFKCIQTKGLELGDKYGEFIVTKA